MALYDGASARNIYTVILSFMSIQLLKLSDLQRKTDGRTGSRKNGAPRRGCSKK
jgi:hypothetical protein